MSVNIDQGTIMQLLFLFLLILQKVFQHMRKFCSQFKGVV